MVRNYQLFIGTSCRYLGNFTMAFSHHLACLTDGFDFIITFKMIMFVSGPIRNSLHTFVHSLSCQLETVTMCYMEFIFVAQSVIEKRKDKRHDTKRRECSLERQLRIYMVSNGTCLRN